MAERIRWSERDAGQKLSIVMMLLVMSGCALFAAWSLVVDLKAGDIWRAGAAGTLVAVWALWTGVLVRQLGMFDARR